MNLLKTHKKIEDDKLKEFNKKLKDINLDFIRFQINNECRAIIANIYQQNDQYPPSALIDFVCSGSQLTFRPIDQAEKDEMNNKLLKAQGIDLPDKGIIK